MKHDNFRIKRLHPAIALLAMSAAMGGAQGIERIKQKEEEYQGEDPLTELDKLKLQKAAEKRQRRAIKCIHQGDSKKNS